MNISTVNELIRSLESAGELSIREQKFLKLAKAYQQLAADRDAVVAENAALKSAIDHTIEWIESTNGDPCDVVIIKGIETPATDRIVAAQRSAFVDEAVSKITESGALTLGDCIVALCQLREGASE